MTNTHEVEIGQSGSSVVESGLFERLQLARWVIAGRTYAFPVRRLVEEGANRVIERERAYRDGAKLDDTGSKAKRWTMEVLFENTIEEDGLDEANQGAALYPDVLNDMIFAFDTHETGDLYVPTIGKQRVRAVSYTRSELSEDRDSALVTFIFLEDNEDSVDQRSISAPTANANARRLADATTFDAQSLGAWLDSLEEFVGSLEALANAPGDAVADIERQARRVKFASERVERAFSQPSRDGRRQFKDPDSHRVRRKLLTARDIAARAANDPRFGRTPLIAIVFDRNVSLWDVSAFLGQSFTDLVSVNPALDPFFIEQGTPINVFATEEFLNGAVA